MKPQAILLDFYGTLAETPDWGPSWEELVAELGYTLPPSVRDRWWHDGLDGTTHDEPSQSREHYVAWQQARLHAMLDDCGIPAEGHERFIERVREISGHRRIVAFAEVPKVLAELRTRGFLLAVCSNWDWDLREAVEESGLTDAVDVVVSSAWVGARKPHRRIYDHLLSALDLFPDEVLFVGDTWSCDVEGPRGLGMQAVYVRRPQFGVDTTRPADVADDPGVHAATDLTILLELLDG